MIRTLGIAGLAAVACFWSAASAQGTGPVDVTSSNTPGHGALLDDPLASFKLFPQDPDARRAAVLKREGATSAGKHDWAASRNAYEQAVRLTPYDIDARVGLGRALQALNDPSAREQADWLRNRARACGYTCPDAPHLKALERAGFFSAT